MIQAPFTLDELDSLAKEHFDTLTNHFNLHGSLDDVSRTHENRNIQQIGGYLRDNLFEIISGQPSILKNHLGAISHHIEAYKDNFRRENPDVKIRYFEGAFNKNLGAIFLPIFNYDHNSEGYVKRSYKGIAGGLAYEHAKILSFNTCLYCNAQFTFTLSRKKRVKVGVEQSAFKTRPNFDHFMSKSRYPFFALSFYNLIPACKVCNSDLKGAREFHSDTHLHPFIEGLQDTIEFKTNISAVDYMTGNSDFEIDIAECEEADGDKVKRIQASLAVFAVKERYNEHKDYAGEIIKKAYMYNNEPALKSLFEGFRVPGTKRSIFSNESEIIELALGNYLRTSHIHKRILSKLAKDIAKEVGLKVAE